jgi:hypothetical protein
MRLSVFCGYFSAKNGGAMTVDNNLFDSLFLENRSISMALDSFAESVKDDFLFMRSAQKKSYNSTTDVTSNKNNNTDEASSPIFCRKITTKN